MIAHDETTFGNGKVERNEKKLGELKTRRSEVKIFCNCSSSFQIKDSFTCERTTKFDPEESNSTLSLENK